MRRFTRGEPGRLPTRSSGDAQMGAFRCGDARREAGYQLDQVQRGNDPDDWKPMRSVGQSVREIRIHEESGAFRVI
jgi:phage-related protein